MDKKKTSIKWKVLSIGLFPTVFLGVVTFIFGIILLYGFAEENVKRELQTTTYMLKGSFDVAVRGDYEYQNNILTKGKVNISDSSMLYDIKRQSQVDTSIFWGDNRVLSTVENKEGVSAVGSCADPDIVKSVIEKGNDLFKRRININDRSYVGFYTPLRNEDGTVIGMAFAGKPVEIVYQDVEKIILFFLLFTILAVVFAITMSRSFSRSLVLDIDLIKKYLRTISNGNLLISMDKRIIDRRDELGEIGIYAAKMSNDLKSLIELDPLTSLYNRRTCHNRVKLLLKEEKPFVFVMCDIDWFKKINDNYGHACGDYILVRIAKMLKDSVGEFGFASRWGGEEFLLVYQMDFDAVKKKVEELMENIRNYNFQYEGQEIHATMTFGMRKMDANIPYEKVIDAADDNLYKGKNQGRDQIVY